MDAGAHVRATRPGPQDRPDGMRVIVRRERPHPGAQLRLTDADGWRITCFVINTRGPGWTLPILEVRHRQRARAEDRIRTLEDTGMRNLPFHGFAQSRSGSKFFPSQPNSSHGCKPSAGSRMHRSADENPNGYACGSSPSPDASSAPTADDCSDSREAGPTTTSWTPPQPPWTPPDHPTQPRELRPIRGSRTELCSHC